jgi:uncharacterized protein DUF2399
MLIVEKEGVVEQLAPFADEKGIALLNTRGFLTEYASILSQQASKNGCNISILTDFDASGLLIALKIPDAYRIGIDFETLDYFGLNPSMVEEKYKPQQNHLKPLEGSTGIGGFLDITSEEYDDEKIEYVSNKRIEIDSVMAAVNDNAKFWEFILSKLKEKFPTRNYNRAINMPEYVVPSSLESLNNIVRIKLTSILENERIRMRNKFSSTTGFLDVKGDELSILEQFRVIIENDDSIKPLLEKIDNLAKSAFP